MRMVKYKAFIKSIKEIVDVEWIDFKNKQITYNGIDFEGFGLVDQSNFEDIELIEFTGLKDKNGREIYEGDVYGYTLTIDGSHWNEHQVQSSDVVKFEDGAFYHGEHLLSTAIEYDNTLTYLGNIYEHPHLLGGDS